MPSKHAAEAGVLAVVGVGLLFHSVPLEVIGGVLLCVAVGLVVPSLLPSRPALAALAPDLVAEDRRAAETPTAAGDSHNAVQIRLLQRCSDKGRAILANASASPIFTTFAADQAKRWYHEVCEVLDRDQRKRFAAVGPIWSATPDALMGSLKDHLGVLEEIISELRPKQPAGDFHSSP